MLTTNPLMTDLMSRELKGDSMFHVGNVVIELREKRHWNTAQLAQIASVDGLRVPFDRRAVPNRHRAMRPH